MAVQFILCSLTNITCPFSELSTSGDLKPGDLFSYENENNPIDICAL